MKFKSEKSLKQKTVTDVFSKSDLSEGNLYIVVCGSDSTNYPRHDSTESGLYLNDVVLVQRLVDDMAYQVVINLSCPSNGVLLVKNLDDGFRFQRFNEVLNLTLENDE